MSIGEYRTFSYREEILWIFLDILLDFLFLDVLFFLDYLPVQWFGSFCSFSLFPVSFYLSLGLNFTFFTLFNIGPNVFGVYSA